MNTLIIVSGHCGTTMKAGKMLADKIGGADIYDTNNMNETFDFSQYDCYVFGSNIRMFMLNFKFSKSARKLRKYYHDRSVYGYLIGASEHNERILEKFSRKLKNNKGTVYAWGELAVDGAVGPTQKMYVDMISDCLAKGKALPHIKEDEIDKLAQLIINK